MVWHPWLCRPDVSWVGEFKLVEILGVRIKRKLGWTHARADKSWGITI